MSERTDLNLHPVPVNQVFRKFSEEYFLDSIAPGTRVLDCGCGDGAISLPLAERGCEVDAFDMQRDRIERLNQYRGDLNIRAITADFWDLPYQPASFDYVSSRQFLPHFPNWPQVLERKLKFCKPGGKLVFHHNSEDNRVAAKQWARNKEHADTVLSKNKGSHAGKTTLTELERFCARNGCTLERATPLSFFLPNSPFMNSSFDKKGRDAYARQLAERMADRVVYDFVYWFEKSVVSHLPQSLASQLFVVIAKH